MAFNIPGPPSIANTPSLGQFNWIDSLSKGYDAGVKPYKIAEDLLKARLNNQIDAAKAKYADQNENALLQGRLGANESRSITNRGLGERLNALLRNRQLMNTKLGNEIANSQFESDLNKKLMSDMGGHSNDDYADQSSNQSTSKDNTTVVHPGNANLYHIDEMYDKDPLAQKFLEKRGFKKTQVTKYDPKTGLTSVVTTSPSGKVQVSTSGTKSSNGASPLTNSTRSKLQIQKQAIPQLKALIKQLKDAPSPFEPELPFGIGNLYRASDRANYHSLVNTGKDLFVKSKGINATDKTLETGEKVLARGKLETDKAYHKRLDDLDRLLDDDARDINQALDKGISTAKSDKNAAKNWGDGVGEIKDPTTNKWVSIPVKAGEWEEFLKDGGRRNG